MSTEQQKLFNWFQENSRPLPWRQTQDPYAIWISEVMLQQTTTQAVIPFYERFIAKFPSVKMMARSSLAEVYELWSGLGYYSRARNLHAAAQMIAQSGFPKTWQQLIELPGFGPYTSRAVASIAFDQNVGVLDGNVIRFLTRYHLRDCAWWKVSERNELQQLADLWVQGFSARQMNQALMEIGATVCTAQKPACLLCPVWKTCKAFHFQQVHLLPRKRETRKKEIWYWSPYIFVKDKKVAFIKNDYAPFLKGELLFPGEIKKLRHRPKTFDFRHAITHHEIYVRLVFKSAKNFALQNRHRMQWMRVNEIASFTPASLIQKVVEKVF